MRIAVVYVAVTNGRHTSNYCSRFAATWHEYPPSFPYDLFVACNGGPLSLEQNIMLAPLHPRMIVRENDPGFDVSAFQHAAFGPCRDYDAILFMGESIYFTRAGWLLRLVEAWNRVGPGFFGMFASNQIRAHLQTTAFFCSPAVFRSYPVRPRNRQQRFEFEHGERALWRRVARSGKPVRCVTWSGEWEPKDWRRPVNGLWKGDQSDLLFWNNHAQAWAQVTPLYRHQWTTLADGLFK